MTAKLQLRIMVAVLLIVGLGLASYKHLVLGFPLSPGAQETVWTAEARITFRATGEPAKVRLNLPDSTPNLLVVDQGAAAAGFGFHVEVEDGERVGVWQARAPSGKTSVYYRARVFRGGAAADADRGEAPEPPKPPVFEPTVANAADAILQDAYNFSSDHVGLAVRLAEQLRNDASSDLRTTALLSDEPSVAERNAMLIQLLHAAEVPAHLLRGVWLEDEEGRSSNLRALAEIWDGEQWVVVDPETGITGLPELFLPWKRGGEALFEVEGGRDSAISFSVIADRLAARNLAIQYGEQSGSALIDFSIFSLPVEVQNTFATLLLIPIGALVVVILRNLVGLQTSGTFMPILIALVFVQTELVTGLILFLVVVGIGLVIRGYLTSLNLLLVPRIAAVLIVVITLYIALSVIGYKMGVTAALTITFFPMIIISWTIERMSVLAEEEGMRDVFIQGGGSLVTAVITYLVMTERHVSYLVFAYPGLLLVVLAVILLIGQYTGYRLSELRRFEPLARNE